MKRWRAIDRHTRHGDSVPNEPGRDAHLGIGPSIWHLNAKSNGRRDGKNRLIRDLVSRQQPEIRLAYQLGNFVLRSQIERYLGTLAELRNPEIFESTR